MKRRVPHSRRRSDDGLATGNGCFSAASWQPSGIEGGHRPAVSHARASNPKPLLAAEDLTVRRYRVRQGRTRLRRGARDTQLGASLLPEANDPDLSAPENLLTGVPEHACLAVTERASPDRPRGTPEVQYPRRWVDAAPRLFTGRGRGCSKRDLGAKWPYAPFGRLESRFHNSHRSSFRRI